jgi:SAM-dependent methyltransferase
VLQHLSKDDARAALREAGRVLRPGGTALVQLPNVFGLRNLARQARRRFRDEGGFSVRYWRPRELLEAFAAAVGPAALEIDGFFSLNAQAADLPLLPPRSRAVVRASELLRRAGRAVPRLTLVADSLYVRAQKP